MNLNQVPNFRTEDFESENQSMLSKLFIQLNPFVQAVNSVFSQNVDYSTNIKAVTVSYSITTFQAFSFKWTFPTAAPSSLQVIKATSGSAKTATILLAPWSYDTSTNLISIDSMMEVTSTGIAALSGSYTFTIRATV